MALAHHDNMYTIQLTRGHLRHDTKKFKSAELYVKNPFTVPTAIGYVGVGELQIQIATSGGRK